MKRRIFLVIAVLLIVAGLFLFSKVVAGLILPKGKGGLQVTSNIEAQVFINSKAVGNTPLCFCDPNKTLTAEPYDIKIVPKSSSEQPYSARIIVNPNVLTVVDRIFLPGAYSSSHILTLEKTNNRDAEVFISSIPDGALITIDGESRGVTPLNVKSISASDHEVEIEKIGFAKKTIRIRTVIGFKLVLNAILGTEGANDEITNTTITPSPTQPTISPTPLPIKAKIIILDTPNGFLRVREEPTTASSEIGRVNSGEIFNYIDENTSWFKIEMEDGTTGWISKTYSRKQASE